MPLQKKTNPKNTQIPSSCACRVLVCISNQKKNEESLLENATESQQKENFVTQKNANINLKNTCPKVNRRLGRRKMYSSSITNSKN